MEEKGGQGRGKEGSEKMDRSDGQKQCFKVKLTSMIDVKNVFYRAMHFSAKRGIEIVCCPSVCLSVP